MSVVGHVRAVAVQGQFASCMFDVIKLGSINFSPLTSEVGAEGIGSKFKLTAGG